MYCVAIQRMNGLSAVSVTITFGLQFLGGAPHLFAREVFRKWSGVQASRDSTSPVC
jgi:hypothetical protein